jgi:type II secretory pathway predicted ATPase ExeA
MDLSESVTYFRHHLALAGWTDPLIADGACARLHKASGGLPRALNNAAIAALIAAATAGKALVDDQCAKRPWPSSRGSDAHAHTTSAPVLRERLTIPR